MPTAFSRFSPQAAGEGVSDLIVQKCSDDVRVEQLGCQQIRAVIGAPETIFLKGRPSLVKSKSRPRR